MKKEKWRIVINGKVKTAVTTIKSIAAMNEAVRIYRRALQRLANK